MPEYDPSLTMYVLNMLIISLNHIISSRDRRTLEREYTNIIANLNFNENQIEPQIMSLFREISYVIGNKRLNDKIKQAIASTEPQREQENSFVRSIRRLYSNARDSFLKDPEKWYVHPIRSSIYVTVSTTQQNDTELRLSQEELQEYCELLSKLLIASLELVRKHELMGVIRENNLKDLTRALSVEDPSKRQLLLGTIARDFSEYAPYWFYRAEASIEAEDYEKADEYLEKFMRLRKPVLTRDIYMAEAMKYKIGILMHNGVNYGNVEEILSCLSEMLAHTPQNWTSHLFAGTTYFSLGRKNEAIEHVMISQTLNEENEEIQKILESMEKDEVPPRIEPLSDEDFVNLCEDGDAKKVEEALKLGANANAKKENCTALTWILYKGVILSSVKFIELIKTIELLLDNGADANAKGYLGMNALTWVTAHSNIKAVELLLRHGADVNAKNDGGTTALMWATNSGIVELLLDNGADVNAKANNGETPLMGVASFRGEWITLGLSGAAENAEIAELLLDNGADVNAKDHYGMTALMYARNAQVAEVLMKYGANVNAKDALGKTALIHAILGNNVEVAELLLKHGADVNAKYDNGIISRTALILAIMNNNVEVAELLLKHDADVNAKDGGGMTALMWATDSGIVELLLKHKANINARDNEGRTVLMWLGSVNAQVAELLLEHGAKINAKDNNGMTALMFAVNTQITELLLQHGAKINVKDNNGMTALMWAEERCHRKIARLLRAHGAK